VASDLRPPIPYFGGKITAAARIVEVFPRHLHYVEPYAGSLAVLLAKSRSQHETVNDIDGDLVTFWRVLRDRPRELARACGLTPHSRSEQQNSYDEDGLPDLELARRVFVQLTQGRNGVRRRTGWRHYVDPAQSPGFALPDYLDGYLARLHAAAERIAGVSLECRPALDLIERYGRAGDGVLLYVDPPYLGSTRSKSYDGYLHEMRAEADHRELAAALNTCTSAVVLSGYPSPLYDLELYPGWHRLTFPASTGQGGTWANRTEALWSNRPFTADAQLTLTNPTTSPHDDQERPA
jgi:DNA adenine methylase